MPYVGGIREGVSEATPFMGMSDNTLYGLMSPEKGWDFGTTAPCGPGMKHAKYGRKRDRFSSPVLLA